MRVNTFLNIIWNLTKLNWFSKTHLGFYADVNFLYGHVKKFVKNYVDPKDKIQLNEGWKLLQDLPIIIYYSNFGESQLINNLLRENLHLIEKDIRHCLNNAIKGLPINKLDIPYSNGAITPKMINGFKKVDKGKYEDAHHLSFASSSEFPLITGEKGEKLETWKRFYKPTISTSKFWIYIEELHNELKKGQKVDKEFALNFLLSKKFL